MKSKLYSIFVASVVLSGSVFAQENGKSEPGAGTSELKAGPISFSVAVSSTESGNAAKTPYLGVSTAPLSPQLRSQLNLPEGMGLSVEMVAKDSPAEKAGLKRYDVLKKFNDQMLCAQEQLAVLVKAAGKGAKVTLVVLRGGQEQSLDATLDEHDAPEVGKAQFSINGAPGATIEVHDLDKMLREGVAENLLPEILKFAVDGLAGKVGSDGIQQNYEKSRKKFEQRRKELDAKAEDDASETKGASNAGEQSASTSAQIFSIYPNKQSTSMITVSDADGIVEINQSNGKRTVKIKGPSGKEIYSGDLNTEADHDAVPEKFRGKVKDAETKVKTGFKAGIKKLFELNSAALKTESGAG